VHVIDIVLPFSADGFYRFGELATHIARALVPPQENDGDWLLSVTCWKDDGSAEGLFTRRFAPEGTFTASLEDANAWPAEIMDISGEPADRACSHLFTLMWHAKRQPPERHRYMLDGSLVIDTMCDCSKQVRDLTSYECFLNYQSALAEAVSTGALEVCDSFGLPLKFKHGQMLLNGVVHIDSLNVWGANLPGGQKFMMTKPPEEAEPLAPSIKPLQRSAAQDDVILAVITNLGLDPKQLPKNKSGQPGIKASIREAVSRDRKDLFQPGSRTFDSPP